MWLSIAGLTDQAAKRMVELPDRPHTGDTRLVELPLYPIHRLERTGSAVMVEGEKSAEALIAIGVPAIGTVTGASGTPGRGPLAELTGLEGLPVA